MMGAFDRESSARGLFSLLVFCFLLSGAACLCYQVLWQRVLVLGVGADIVSSTLVVASFMFGLGVGAAAGGVLAARLSPGAAVAAFALCELAIGALGAGSVGFFQDVLDPVLSSPGLDEWSRFGLVLASLLGPTFLMGMSLPLLTRGLVRSASEAGSRIGTLYGWNACGAALGAWFTGFYLVGTVGVGPATWMAASVNVLCSIAAIVGAALVGATESANQTGSEAAGPSSVSGRSPDKSEGGYRANEAAGEKSAEDGPPVRLWILAYGVAGFVGLSLEVVWFRMLDTLMKSNAYTFSHVVGLYISGLAAGALLGTRRLKNCGSPGTWFAWLQWFAPAYAAASTLALVFWLRADPPFAQYLASYEGIDFKYVWRLWSEGSPMLNPLLTALGGLYVALPLLVLGPPTLAMGMSFPLLHHHLRSSPRLASRRVGLSQAANILGSTAGVLLTGLVLLGTLGSTNMLRLLLGLGVLLLVVLLPMAGGPSQRPRAAAAMAFSLLVAALLPDNDSFQKLLHGAARIPAVVAENRSCVSLVRYNEEIRRYEHFVNGLGQGALPPFNVHLLLGIVPTLVHPDPRDVLIVGLGSGATAYAARSRPEVGHVTCVEMCSAQFDTLVQTAQRFGEPLSTALLATPGLSLAGGDGRGYLARSEKSFDIVEIDAIRPTAAGSGTLYSREFFELVKTKLKPGGIFCCWVPTARVLRTLRTVFPHGLLLTGTRVALVSSEPIEWPAERIRERFSNENVRAHWKRGGLDPAGFETLLAGQEVSAWDSIQDESEDVNRDLWPRDEFFLNGRLDEHD